MEKKKSILRDSLIASAIVACSAFTATDASAMFNHNTLGSGSAVKINLSNEVMTGRNVDVTYATGALSHTKKNCKKKCHKKDGKCGSKKEGKCGNMKTDENK